jgi:siroheme synthase
MTIEEALDFLHDEIRVLKGVTLAVALAQIAHLILTHRKHRGE